MTLYTANATVNMPEFVHYQVDADDVEDAEFQMTALIKEDFPEASSYIIENIEKVN